MIDFKIRVFGELPTAPYPVDVTDAAALFGRQPEDFSRWTVDDSR